MKKRPRQLHHLETLSVIDHPEVTSLLECSRKNIIDALQPKLFEFRKYVDWKGFLKLRTLLDTLAPIYRCFPFLPTPYIELQNYFTESEDRYNKEKEREWEVLGQIKECVALLGKQKEITEKRLKEQDEKYAAIIAELAQQIEQINADHTQMRKKFDQEIEIQLASKIAELKQAQGQTQQEMEARIAQAKLELRQVYEEQFKAEEATYNVRLQASQELLSHTKAEGDAARQQLQQQIKTLAEQQERKAEEIAVAELNAKLSSGDLPYVFGARDWNKYFGEIGPIPPLPSDMAQILRSKCPFWPDKRVEETHTLVLIPGAVDGKLLTLNSLEELIQHPKNGGHATRYGFYSEYVKKQHGGPGFFGGLLVRPSPAYWVLMTKDVLPGSRRKSYDTQVAIVNRHRGYEVPRAIEAAVTILMGYIKTGIRGGYTDKPETYTRCQEVVKYDWGEVRLALGGLGSSGLYVRNLNFDEDENHGVGALRKFRS